MIKKLTVLFCVFIFATACEEGNNAIYTVLNDYQTGAVLRTISQSGEYNVYDTSGSVFELEIEEHDTENGALLQSVDVFISLNSGGETLLRSLKPAEFSTGPKGLPRTKMDISLADVLATLQLRSTDVTGGDAIHIRLQLNLTNGNSYTAKDAASSLTGSYFASPYQYSKVIKCIPIGTIDGVYTLHLNDSYGDGWNGAQLVVTVDGSATEYTLEDGASGKFEHTIEGASSMSFAFVSGDWDSEVTYSIVYSELDGTNSQTAISDGPTPAVGEKTLSVCQ